MKFSAYILSIIVFVLTIMPCVDKPINNSANILTTQQTNTSHQNDIDHCSPFCTCQCCQTSFHSPIVHSISFSFFIVAEYFCVNQGIANSFIPEFYIPPKA